MTGRERAPVVPPIDWSPTIVQRIAQYARRRRDGGLDPWFDFEQASRALPDIPRDTVREGLRRLVVNGSLRRDPGAQGLESVRQPDKWRCT